ncbi:unnamed protein product [Adineta ricciae]|nr:unnamed protein product [Adineta ricciae]
MLLLACVILIPIAITVPMVLVNKKKANSSTTPSSTSTTEAPLYNIITNTTKWKQNGITIFQAVDFDEGTGDLSSMDIDNNGTIYMAETMKDRIIEIKFGETGFSIINGSDDVHQLFRPTDVIVDQKTDSIIICDAGNRRILRWSRQNISNREIVISNVYCIGLALDDDGYLYVSISELGKHEIRRWNLGINRTSTLIAGGGTSEDHFAQLKMPNFLFIDEDYSLYVADTQNHRVMKWRKNSKAGSCVAGGNGAGTNLTQLSYPTGVVVDHLGNIYIADSNNNRIVRWIKGANKGSIVAGGNGPGNGTDQLWAPYDLLFDKYGNLYVFDAGNHRLQKFFIESN